MGGGAKVIIMSYNASSSFCSVYCTCLKTSVEGNSRNPRRRQTIQNARALQARQLLVAHFVGEELPVGHRKVRAVFPGSSVPGTLGQRQQAGKQHKVKRRLVLDQLRPHKRLDS